MLPPDKCSHRIAPVDAMVIAVSATKKHKKQLGFS
jgi:hypothetical protein